MPGYRKKFVLIKRPKKSGYVWYYRLADEKTAHSTGKTPKREAAEYVENEILPYTAAHSRITLGEYLRPYFVWDKCPHVRRLRTEGKSISPSYAKDQRRRIEMYILGDPICDIPIGHLKRADILDFRERLFDPQHEPVVGARTANCTMGALKTALREALKKVLIRRGG